VSEELLRQIRSKCERMARMRSRIEKSLQEKEVVIAALRQYEAKRVLVFSQSLHVVTQGTLNTLSVIKDAGGKLRRLKQFLMDRAALEREYAAKLEALGRKCSQVDGGGSSSGGSGAASEFFLTTMSQTSGQEDLQDNASNMPPRVDSAKVLFASLGFCSHSTASRIQEYASTLAEQLTAEIDLLGVEVQHVLKEARNIFRKNSDICRLSESAVSNCAKSVQCIYDSVSAALIVEVAKLSEELNALKGSEEDGSRSHLHSHSSLLASSPGSSVETEDLWLGVQRYRQAVRNSQESLCILLSEEMDLQLQQQILSNKAHSLMLAVAKSYAAEQSSVLQESQSFLAGVLGETVRSMVNAGIPHPVLQSPFAKLQQQHQMLNLSTPPSSPSSSASLPAALSSRSSSPTSSSSAALLSPGAGEEAAWAFTSLFDSQLPSCPGVVLAANMLLASTEFFRLNMVAKYRTGSTDSKGEEQIGDGDGGVLRFDTEEEEDEEEGAGEVWRAVFVVATADRHLHVLHRQRIQDMPIKSFNLQHCDVLPVARGLLDDADRGVSVLEVRPHPAARRKGQWTRATPSSTAVEGVFLKVCEQTASAAEEQISRWVSCLVNPLDCDTYIEPTVEAATLAAMRKSIPILRGETSKVTLSVLEQEVQQRSEQVLFPQQEGGGEEAEGEKDEEGDEASKGSSQRGDSDEEGEVGADPPDSTQPDPSQPLSSNTADNSSNSTHTTASNTSQKPLKTSPLFGYLAPQQYRKQQGGGTGSWQMRDSYGGSTSSHSEDKGLMLVAPQRLIPKSDKSMPLAKRHSLMIEQYQKGLQEEMERERIRISEQRRHRTLEATKGLGSGSGDADSDANNICSSGGDEDGQEVTVKKLSRRFTFATGQSSSAKQLPVRPPSISSTVSSSSISSAVSETTKD